MSDNKITRPVVLDQTGQIMAEGIKSIAAALWAAKQPEVPLRDVNFYDYDGTVVYSYTRAEFLGLTELPANPAHTGLTAQGWNWDLAAAQSYVQQYGSCEIGQTYITDDGKTRLYVQISKTEAFAVKLQFNMSAANGVTIDWGDGSAPETAATAGNVAITHTYTTEGNYIISMTVADGCSVRLGTATGTGATLASVGGSAKCFFTQGLRTAGGNTGRDALVAIEVGSGVTDIGSGAFAYATSLKTVTLPNTVTTIRNLAFAACISLEGVVLPNGITSIEQLLVGYCYRATAVCVPPSVTSIGAQAFRTCTSVKRLSIPDGVTSIPLSAFYSCHIASVISIPDSVAGAIGNYAFYGCYQLRKVNVPSGVTSIGTCSFDQCFNMREIELPEGVTTIGQLAFRSCFGIDGFIIPSTVTKINKFAFLYNDGANSFHVRATTPPTLELTAFTETVTDLVIYVPYSADHSVLNAYLAATGWSGKGDSIVEEPAA